MTYSIVARDPETGELGVAVQTCMVGVGTIVPWAQAGVGAVATQAIAEPAYGWRCLDALAAGLGAEEALARARAADGGAALRQVGVVDATGAVASSTGELCIDYAGHHVGEGYTVQANMMSSPDVWPAMARAYDSAAGDLGARMLAALQAAEAAGGDARGQMSAAMLIQDGSVHDHPREGVRLDIRVDDHPSPVEELERLHRAGLAFAAFGRSNEALFGGDPMEALREVDGALRLLPGDENLHFLRAGALLLSGHRDEAAAETRALVAGRAGWATILRSFAAKGLLRVPDGLDVEAFLSG